MTAIPSQYLAIPTSRIKEDELVLRPVAPRDIESIRVWRNAQMEVLRQTAPISSEEQLRYFSQHVWPCMESLHPSQILFSIERFGLLIGYGGLVHLNWEARRAEISFLLRPDLESHPETLSKVFSGYLNVIFKIAFLSLGLNRLSTETFEFRSIHLKVIKESGLKFEGTLREQVMVRGEAFNSHLHGILVSEWSNSRPTIRNEIGILVTSASRKVPLVRALKEASQKLGSKSRIIAGDIDSLAIAQFEADDFWKMPELNTVTVEEIIDECRRRDVKVIFPTRDGELEYWAHHRDVFLKSGIDVIVSCIQSISRCRDKLAFAQFGKKTGLPVVPATASPEGVVESLFVVKERFGAGSKRIGLGLSRTAALDHAKGLENPIFQPFVVGVEISIDGWISKAEDVTGVILRRRDVLTAGESQITTTFKDMGIEKDAVNVIKALRLRGPVVLQGFITADGLKIIECNPRFGGASTASIAAGLDSLYWSLAEALDSKFRPVFQRTASEVRQVRFPVDRVFYGSCF